jgi:SnoaL-like domain
VDLTPQMQKTLQEIIDHHEIRKLLNVYSHGCDRGDTHRMASVYLEDAWDDHGTYKGFGKGFVKQVMGNLAGEKQKLVHLLGQSLIEVRGDEAGAETYFMASNGKTNEGGREVVHLLSGRYVDTLRRENGAWKIAKRICVRDWSMSLDVEKDWLENSNFVEGRMSGQDPSYEVLGLEHPGLPAGS